MRKWYTKGLGYPVMQISKGFFDGGGNYKIARYSSSLVPVSSGIDKIFSDQKNTTVFPNPFTTKAVLKLGSGAPINNFTLFIIDFYGRTVLKHDYSEREVTIDRNNLQPGIYFFMVSGKNYTDIGKFIITNNQ